MPGSRPSRAARDAYPASLQADILVARVLELPPAQQLRVHDVLEEVLGEERLGVQTQRSKEVRARAEALEAMRPAPPPTSACQRARRRASRSTSARRRRPTSA